MKISSGWKVIFYIFAILGLFQLYGEGFRLMNKPDSFIANAGLITVGIILAATVYCLIQLAVTGVKFVKEVEGKEENK